MPDNVCYNYQNISSLSYSQLVTSAMGMLLPIIWILKAKLYHTDISETPATKQKRDFMPKI
jgi:hypothetical protein